MNPKLEELRGQLDDIDSKIIALLGKRFEITTLVGELKRDTKVAPIDPEREARQMKRIKVLAVDAGVNPELAVDLLRLVIDEVVRNHKKIREDS